MTRITRYTGGLAAALMLALAPLSAVAADNAADGNAADGGQQAESASGKPVTDAQLEKFAAAYGKLQQVRRQYGQKMQQADKKAERKQLRKEGQQKMVGAIRSEGLKIAEYRRIGQKLNQDKELRSRLQSMLQEMGGGQGSSGQGSSGQTGSSG